MTKKIRFNTSPLTEAMDNLDRIPQTVKVPKKKINESFPTTINWFVIEDWFKDDFEGTGYDFTLDFTSEDAQDKTGAERIIEGKLSKDGKILDITFFGDVNKISFFTKPESKNVKYRIYSERDFDLISKDLIKIFEDVY